MNCLFKLVTYVHMVLEGPASMGVKAAESSMFIFVLEENTCMNTKYIPSDSSPKTEHSLKHDSSVFHFGFFFLGKGENMMLKLGKRNLLWSSTLRKAHL